MGQTTALFRLWIPKVLWAWLWLVFFYSPLFAQSKLTASYVFSDSTNPHIETVRLGLPSAFNNNMQAENAFKEKLVEWQARGFAAAAIDSVLWTDNKVKVIWYLGPRYKWGELKVSGGDKALLQQLGFPVWNWEGKPFQFQQWQNVQEKVVGYLENHGYPFGLVAFDSLQLNENGNIQANLKIENGPYYTLDSILLLGNVKLKPAFLQRYLQLNTRAEFNRKGLEQVDPLLTQLPYLQLRQPSTLTLLPEGYRLNVFADKRPSSQVNVLLGLLPNNQQLASNKLLLTGEANVLLRNSLGAGETLGLNWQQIQVESPRLNVLVQRPFLFNSPFGLDVNFDFLKKDSSYINLNLLAGIQYFISGKRQGKFFFQQWATNLLANGIDTIAVIQNKRLPEIIDTRTSSVGAGFQWWETDYRFNPRKGWEASIQLAAGIRKIKINNTIVDLKDPSQPDFDFSTLYDTVATSSYQFRIQPSIAGYWPFGKASVIKTAFQGGWLQSPQLYRNELFQIGGYKLLRGFDEESLFANLYAITTLEYRLLLGQNANFFVFSDQGWVKQQTTTVKQQGFYWGVGTGLSLETKAGIVNMAFAVGKQPDNGFNFRQAKIHIGYINFF